MSHSEDNRLVDYLFDEMSEEDARAYERLVSEDASLSAEVESFDDTLAMLRTLEDEEPSAHLDSLILATAREVAGEVEGKSFWARVRKMVLSPMAGLAAAASMAAIAGIVLMPQLQSSNEAVVATEAVPLGTAAPAAAPAEQAAASEDERSEELAFAPKDKGSAAVDGPPPPPVVSREVRQAPKKRSRKAAARRPMPMDSLSIVADDEAKADSVKREQIAKEVTKAPAQVFAAKPPPEPAPEPEPKPSVRRAPARSMLKLKAAKQSGAGPAMDPAGATSGANEPSRGAVGRSDLGQTRGGAPTGGKRETVREALEEGGAETADKDVEQQLDESRSVDQSVAFASAAIRAANQEILRRQPDSARRILERAVQRTRGSPSQGDVLLRWAYLERDQERFTVCVSLAQRALAVQGFTQRREAEALIRQVSSRIDRDQQMAPAAPPR